MSSITLSPNEADAVQDWIARRYLQIRFPLVGRRHYDQQARFAGDVERYIRWQLEREPWRRRADGR
jgi:hypothetical protein